MSLPVRIRNKLGDTLSPLLGTDYVSRLRLRKRTDLERLGSAHGGWVVPLGGLDASSVCYCAGCGEDITFDLALIERTGCTVHGFDPTPRAVAHVEKVTGDVPRYVFEPVGLWDEPGTLRFFEPENEKNVSHSLVALHGSERWIEVPVKTLSQVMAQHGHERIDLLKLDIEGSEYKVVDSMLDAALDVRVLCVEYDEYLSPLDGGARARIAASMRRLADAGYALVSMQGAGNYTFVRDG